MSLIKWRRNLDLFPSLSPMVDDLLGDDDFFRMKKWWDNGGTVPAVNVSETDNSFDLEVAAPGMTREDFTVEVKEGVLTISAETKSEKEEKEENYTRKEFNYRSFKRSFWLPENVNADKIKANYNNGILKLTLPKLKVEVKESAKKIVIS